LFAIVRMMPEMAYFLVVFIKFCLMSGNNYM